jgi:hypothetical protein
LEKFLDFPEQGITLRYHSLRYGKRFDSVEEEGFVLFEGDAELREPDSWYGD